MAKAKPSDEEAVDSPAPKSGKKKGLLFAMIGVLILGVGGGAAWYLSRGKSADHAEAKAEKKPAAPPVFMPIETFTVNLQPEASGAYLQVEMTLRVAEQSVVDAVKQYMPEVRSRILMLLSTKSTAELSSAAGKQKLAEDIRLEITKLIDPDSIPRERKPVIRKTAATEDGASEEDPAAGTDEADTEDTAAEEPAEEQKPEPVEQKILSVLFTSFIIQ